jgi:AmmeMemoRadiSam system protein A
MQGEVLLKLARGTLEESFGAPKQPLPDHGWLFEKRAVFVTLHKHHELRGCIGQLAPRFALHEAVRNAATSAAFHDPRFPRVEREELVHLQIEISVLSPLEALDVRTEEEALARIDAGVHGVVLSHGHRSGVFIPEVWKSLPDKRDFLAHLKRKAGLPMDWLPGTRVERFTAQLWSE